jgi:hypothetical protein
MQVPRPSFSEVNAPTLGTVERMSIISHSWPTSFARGMGMVYEAMGNVSGMQQMTVKLNGQKNVCVRSPPATPSYNGVVLLPR